MAGSALVIACSLTLDYVNAESLVVTHHFRTDALTQKVRNAMLPTSEHCHLLACVLLNTVKI